jgi:hypothetical protein
MKFKIALAALAAIATTSAIAAPSALAAKDELQTFSLADFWANEEYKADLEGYTFSFGGSAKGVDTLTSRKTAKKFGTTAQKACERALASALISFRDAASKNGLTKVAGLKSVVTDVGPFDSKTEYQCRVGNIMVRVYLEGTIQK